MDTRCVERALSRLRGAQTKSIEAVFMLWRTMPFASSSLSPSSEQEVLRVKVGNKLRRRRTLHRHLIVVRKTAEANVGVHGESQMIASIQFVQMEQKLHSKHILHPLLSTIL